MGLVGLLWLLVGRRPGASGSGGGLWLGGSIARAASGLGLPARSTLDRCFRIARLRGTGLLGRLWPAGAKHAPKVHRPCCSVCRMVCWKLLRCIAASCRVFQAPPAEIQFWTVFWRRSVSACSPRWIASRMIGSKPSLRSGGLCPLGREGDGRAFISLPLRAQGLDRSNP
jgi:hypothetical protein